MYGDYFRELLSCLGNLKPNLKVKGSFYQLTEKQLRMIQRSIKNYEYVN